MRLGPQGAVQKEHTYRGLLVTPAEEANRLDRICELIDLGLQALNGYEDERARIGRTALRIAKSEAMLLKDEALLAEALLKTHMPTPSGKRRKPRKK